MPRQPRFVLPGVALHIVQRGNNRGACFVDDRDYLCYLTNLRGLSAKHSCAVHAYCLMTNHVHLLVTPGSSEAPTNLMRDLGQRYVQYYNKRHRRTGTLWEGRFRSCMVESARYVLACYRYIELNPLRAGLVPHPRAYTWSSHAVNVGLQSDPLVSPHPEFIALAEGGLQRCSAYRYLFADVLDQSTVAAIRDATNGSLPLASESFKTQLSARGCKIEHRKPGRRSSQVGVDDESQQEIGL